MADFITRKRRNAIRRLIVPLEVSPGINLAAYDFKLLYMNGNGESPVPGATIETATADDVAAVSQAELPKDKTAYSFIKIFVPGGANPVATGNVTLLVQSVAKANADDIVTHFEIPVQEA